MPESLTTEINVATWLRVIAEMARSRLRRPARTDVDAVFLIREIANEMKTAHAEDIRGKLLELAAEAIRAADEHFPGDGLDLG